MGSEPDKAPETPAARAADGKPFKSGFVAVVGRPNVGKSTLVNRAAGQKVAIVSSKPQTTRFPIRAVLNRPGAQLVFVDTPGIHRPLDPLGEHLNQSAIHRLDEVDVRVFMVDATVDPGPGDAHIAKLLQASKRPTVLVLNKADRVPLLPIPRVEAYKALLPGIGEDDVFAISAQKGRGADRLFDRLLGYLPEGQPYFPEDEVTDQTLRTLAGELIREQVLRQTEQEIPHAVAVRVDEYQEREDGLTYIKATLFVERESQKGILIGDKGSRLKEIGAKARPTIEGLTGGKVYLDLWVKVLPQWRKRARDLKELGYVVE